MEGLLLLAGRVAGIVGLLLCITAAAVRLAGSYFAAGFQVGTFLLAGMALILVSCFCLLWILTARPRR